MASLGSNSPSSKHTGNASSEEIRHDSRRLQSSGIYYRGKSVGVITRYVRTSDSTSDKAIGDYRMRPASLMESRAEKIAQHSYYDTGDCRIFAPRNPESSLHYPYMEGSRL